MRRIILTIIFLLFAGSVFILQSQTLNIGLKTDKDCNAESFYTTIQLYCDSGNYFQIGTSSIELIFNSDAISFSDYQALHFDSTDQCGGIGNLAWLDHRVDTVSFSNQFHLVLSLNDTNLSCPVISYLDTISIGTISFNILQQGANPSIYFDTSMTWFNSNIPNNGAGLLTLGSYTPVDSLGILLCDCPGEGMPCDDNNVLTVNDTYNSFCDCFGEYLDSDNDGILDGIDPCSDVLYEAEDADTAHVEIWNSYYQHTGTGFINFLHSTGDSVQFNIFTADTADYSLGFRYSLSYGSRPLGLTIDGTLVVASLDFPSTGSWNYWDTITYSYYFLPGNHTVLVTTIGSEGPMLDHLKLSHCTSCLTSGNPCNDGDSCTVNDVVDANCNCAGIYIDSDNDGVCDVYDICDGGDDSIDSDFDGVPDFCDECNDLLIGNPCDDGNPCTVNDTLNADCDCVGVFVEPDTDGDGVCDSLDICNGGDDNIDEDMDGIPDDCDTCNDMLFGLPCNDGDTCTILDTYDADCNCVGIVIDSDGDGVCDIMDMCQGYNDSLDVDNDGLPDDCDDCDNTLTGTACDDGDDCTINDTIDINCDCVGEFVDTDNDGVCDAFDQCQGSPDFEDNDGDAIPNDCDDCYDLVYQAEDMYYSSSAIYGTGANSTGTGYVRFTNNIDTIIFNVATGDTGLVTVTIRYAQAEDGKTGMIKFDGQILFENFAYPKVDNEWDVWDTVQFNTYFTSGIHTLELINNDQDPYGPRIDYVSICLPGYIPYPLIAKGNNQFEEGFDNWTRLYNGWLFGGYYQITIDTSNALCGYNDAYVSSVSAYQQLYTTLDNLLIGDTMCLHFYTAGGMANAWVGPSSSSVFEGTYLFVNSLWAQGAYVHDSIEFVVTEPIMKVYFDVFPNNEMYFDNFSFDGYTCEPEPILEISDISCFGETDAAITASCIGGANPISYLWNTGDTVLTISNLGEGIYSVTVSDKNGLTNSTSYEVIEPDKLDLFGNITHETNAGTGDGSIIVMPSGGNIPYYYSWSTSETTNEISGLTAGYYGLSLSDSHGCELDTIFEISNISAFTPPDWNFQVTGISHIVLIQTSGQIIIDSIPLVNGDYIGAFYDSAGVYACAGYMMWLNTIGYITVYGDDSYTPDIEGFSQGDKFNWKAWRHLDSSVVNLTASYITDMPNIPDSGYFAANGISGIYSFSEESVLSTQSIILHPSWDIYSSNLDIVFPDVSQVFSDISNNLIIVKNSNGDVYWPAFGFNNIGDMIIGEGYYVNMLQADTLIISGMTINPEQVPINISEGWSLIAYLRNTPASVVDMFNSIVSHIVLVKDGQGNVYWPIFMVNTIGDMFPGKGYLINMIDSQVFTYPANSSANSKSSQAILTPHHYRNIKTSSNSMTLGIPLSAWPYNIDKADEVGVFSETGLLVAAGVFTGGNLAITIWGDDIYSDFTDGLLSGEQFSLKLWHSASNIEEDIFINSFHSGDNLYSDDKITIIDKLTISDISGNSIILFQNSPNPFKSQTTFSFYLPKSMKIELSIINLLGEKVDVVFSGNKSQGLHSIRYNVSDLAAGSYYYKLEAANSTNSKKMLIIRDK